MLEERNKLLAERQAIIQDLLARTKLGEAEKREYQERFKVKEMELARKEAELAKSREQLRVFQNQIDFLRGQAEPDRRALQRSLDPEVPDGLLEYLRIWLNGHAREFHARGGPASMAAAFRRSLTETPQPERFLEDLKSFGLVDDDLTLTVKGYRIVRQFLDLCRAE